MRDPYVQLALDQALKSYHAGGIPIGSALVRFAPGAEPEVLAVGHNQRVQQGNPILHGEMDCLFNAGRVGSYRHCVLYSTLMPCYMCAGTAVQFRIPRVVVGESVTFGGAPAFMRQHGIEVVDLADAECIALMQRFIAEQPQLWNEDIGEL